MLTAQDVYQILREASTATRPMRRITKIRWDEIYCGLMIHKCGWLGDHPFH
jgi:hypothetical protein